MLAPSLPLEIPTPVAIGGPVEGYLWRWSVYRWIEGEVATPERIVDLNDFARELAQFIGDLQRIDTTDGPRPGAHNFHRGGPLRIYDAQTRQAIAILQGKIDSLRATEIWNTALATTWGRSPVWIHGDVSRGNLLVRRGRLSAVIDFGLLAVGDPACDLSIAWTLFSDRSRDAFRSMLPLDSGTWKRAKGWALWKALIAAAGLNETNAIEGQQCWRTVGEVLQDPRFD
jgi:aminoglycoside phosphotransferase (APT) family kinase protein